jgi:glucose-6-phosphate 1-dehydrogenase
MANSPTTIVIFGASGDLTSRKLIPSLYRMDRKGRLPENIRIIGVARSPFDDNSFRLKMADAIKSLSADDWNEEAWNKFAPRLGYARGDASMDGGLENLQTQLETIENGLPGNRLYYLSVAPQLYPEITKNLGKLGMASSVDGNASNPGWRRLIIEKPFGHDLSTAKSLNRVIRTHFHEDQIYRIDHYLGKETVQNLLVFRFANTLFEPLWNSNYIDHVQITVAETVTIGNRADYYDNAGILRDMFQNHLLQILCLVAMEAPARYAADPLRNEKTKVLDAMPVFSVEEARQRIATGRYQGYLNERGVKPNSQTPTFAAVEFSIDNWRWRGVPFYLRSGKGLALRSSEVVIQFRCPPHLMFPMPPGSSIQCNRLAICIQPDEGIHLNFITKEPDRDGTVLVPSDMEFHYRNAYANVKIPEAYERLLQDALNGDASLFMRSDEIERSWELIEPFLLATEDSHAKTPEDYHIGTMGTTGADALLAKNGRSWISMGLAKKPKD